MARLASLTPTALVLALVLCAAGAVQARSQGVQGASGAQGTTCGSCHGSGASISPTLIGPRVLAPGQTGQYLLLVSDGPAVVTGATVEVVGSGATLGPEDVGLKALSATELTHAGPRAVTKGPAVFPFRLVMPLGFSPVRLYAAALSADGSGEEGGDAAGQLSVEVTVVDRTPPSLSSPPTPQTSPVLAKEVGLTASARDPGGSALRYEWLAVGPAEVTFEPNDSPGAASTRASFSAVGDYLVRLTVLNGANLSATAQLTLPVRPTNTAVTVEPSLVRLAPLAQASFLGVLRDQFGAAVELQPPLVWSVSGGGTISSDGAFQAGDEEGSFLVTASTAGLNGLAKVHVGNANLAGELVQLERDGEAGPVAGSVRVRAFVDASVQLAELIFFIDGLEVRSLKAPPFEHVVDTTALTEGEHALEAIARDVVGDTARSNRLPLIVANTKNATQVFGELGCSGSSGLPAASLLAVVLIQLLLARRLGRL